MRNLRFIKDDIFDERKNYFIFALQLFLTLIITGYVANLYLKAFTSFSIMGAMDSGDNWYKASDTASFVNSTTATYSEDMELVNKVDDYILDNYRCLALTQAEYFTDEDKNPYIYVSFCNKGYIEYYGINAENGASFSQQDYAVTDSGKIPVIAGNGFNGKYSVGDKMFDKYVIIGFLPENFCIASSTSTLMSNNQLVSQINTKMMVFAPYSDKNQMQSLLGQYNEGVQIDMIYAENKTDLLKINEYEDKIGADRSNFISITDNSKMLESGLNKINIPAVFFAGIILIIAIFSISAVMITFVSRRLPELVIHLMSGASPLDIVVRVCGPSLVTALCVNIITGILYRDMGSILTMLSISIVVWAISCIAPIYKLLKKPLAITLKEERN